MLQQKDAIARLLSDDDPLTVDLVKEQLVSNGGEALAELRELLEDQNENVRRHVADVIAEIDARQASRELSIFCPLFPEEGDIEQASWLLARAMLPGTCVERYRGILDRHGLELRKLLQHASHPSERIVVTSGYLCETHGFNGNTSDYYEADNSLLPRILDTRCGIPISLTLLYMIIGRRAGMKIEGVNMPGHFLAMHDGVLFDPFENGRIMTLADCNSILERQNLTFGPEHLAIASPRVMFRRMLANMLYIFQNDGGEAQAEHLAEWIKALDRKK
jgi:regulator of sirC expression with transglutaminase-like and TPR domain